jgi:uncharacterized membrane protein YgdD (TMEM256/DUF423 family)
MRLLLTLSALNGFLAVLLGAFGAHALRARFAGLEDGARRLEWWQTATTYHLVHALALGLVGLAADRLVGGTTSAAGWAFQAGIALFSGSLYVMSLTGVRALGAVTPFGGLAFLAGWLCLGLAAWRMGVGKSA